MAYGGFALDLDFCTTLPFGIDGMNTASKTITYIWAFLIAATIMTWWLGNSRGEFSYNFSNPIPDYALSAGIMLIAAIKVRLIIWHFMEVKEGPIWLRWSFDVWLCMLTTIILGLYYYSL